MRARGAGRGALVVVYAAVLLAPLLLMTGVVKPGARGPLVVFSDALGFAAMSMIALQVFSSGRWPTTTRLFGLRRVLALHRQAGVVVLVLVVLHVAILLVDDPSRLRLLNVPHAPGRARAGVIALIGLVGLGLTSAWRARLGLAYKRWRALHLALTCAVIGGAFVHVMWVDSYSSAPVVRWVVLELVLASAVALFWSRVVHPYEAAARPYRVVDVRRERGDAVTLQLLADGHDGLRFEPGQFARLRLADRPFCLDDHPFTLSSSAASALSPAFTIKALGDFTAGVGALPVGSMVLVDGPHGEGLQDGVGHGRLLVAAGIGITPAVSVLRTAVERGDRRPVLLVYGSRSWPDVIFRDELDWLCQELPALRVEHVLSRPAPGWGGERGRIDRALLRRLAPRDVACWSALVCGPPALVSETVAALAGLGMTSIQAEGFE